MRRTDQPCPTRRTRRYSATSANPGRPGVPAAWPPSRPAAARSPGGAGWSPGGEAGRAGRAGHARCLGACQAPRRCWCLAIAGHRPVGKVILGRGEAQLRRPGDELPVGSGPPRVGGGHPAGRRGDVCGVQQVADNCRGGAKLAGQLRGTDTLVRHRFADDRPIEELAAADVLGSGEGWDLHAGYLTDSLILASISESGRDSGRHVLVQRAPMRLLGEVVYPGDEPPCWIVGPQQGTWLTVSDHGVHRWILASPAGVESGREADLPLGLDRWFQLRSADTGLLSGRRRGCNEGRRR
jgi:hypothetical protein